MPFRMVWANEAGSVGPYGVVEEEPVYCPGTQGILLISTRGEVSIVLV